MNCDIYLPFVEDLLKRLHVRTHIVKDPRLYISSEIDGGLRAMLFGEEDYTKLLVNSPSEAQANMIYRFYDEYLCNYIFLKIPGSETDGCFFVGPYLTKLPTEAFIAGKAEVLSLLPEQVEQLRIYYRNLPIIEEENLLLNIMGTLGRFLWGGVEHFDMEYISYEISDRRKPIFRSGVFDEGEETSVHALSLDIIEENYRNEKRLMEAVSKGRLHQIDVMASTVLNKGTEARLPDSLRNRKNYLIIFNTLLRKAAEQGEVHPYHIHRLSSEVAKRIEALISIESSLELQRDMMRKYCLLVKEHSLRGYSQLIGRVITLIAYDPAADLSLKQIASVMNVNASYLSAAFKKECGETLTEYVTRKRMEQAALILAHSNKQVQTVAEECGIFDGNYFIKLFKKQYGMTPTQYRNEVIRS